MKEVITTPFVDVALRTLDNENRRRVHDWFHRLANWDGDELVRNHSYSLDSLPDVHVLKTDSDLRIFFKIQGNTLTVVDIATRQSIEASGQ
jgi:mRNA-degrading endonuclease RelE of RelBE toxin-antitoxin system